MKTWQQIYVALEHALAQCLRTVLAPWIISSKSQKFCASICPSASKFGFYRNTRESIVSSLKVIGYVTLLQGGFPGILRWRAAHRKSTGQY